MGLIKFYMNVCGTDYLSAYLYGSITPTSEFPTITALEILMAAVASMPDKASSEYAEWEKGYGSANLSDYGLWLRVEDSRLVAYISPTTLQLPGIGTTQKLKTALCTLQGSETVRKYLPFSTESEGAKGKTVHVVRIPVAELLSYATRKLTTLTCKANLANTYGKRRKKNA